MNRAMLLYYLSLFLQHCFQYGERPSDWGKKGKWELPFPLDRTLDLVQYIHFKKASPAPTVGCNSWHSQKSRRSLEYQVTSQDFAYPWRLRLKAVLSCNLTLRGFKPQADPGENRTQVDTHKFRLQFTTCDQIRNSMPWLGCQAHPPIGQGIQLADWKTPAASSLTENTRQLAPNLLMNCI